MNTSSFVYFWAKNIVAGTPLSHMRSGYLHAHEFKLRTDYLHGSQTLVLAERLSSHITTGADHVFWLSAAGGDGLVAKRRNIVRDTLINLHEPKVILFETEKPPTTREEFLELCDVRDTFYKFFSPNEKRPYDYFGPWQAPRAALVKQTMAKLPSTFDLLLAQAVANKFFTDKKWATYIVVLHPNLLREATCHYTFNADEAVLRVPVESSDDGKSQWFRFVHALADALTTRSPHGVHWERKMERISDYVRELSSGGTP